MINHRSYGPRCVTPHCPNAAWISMKIFLCGPCAEDVMNALSDRVDQRVRQKVRDSFWELNQQVKSQAATIEYLRAALNTGPTTRKSPIRGTVYYVQVGAHVKIGWTADMENRMRSYPPNSTLLAQHPGTRKDEAQMHRRFAADRTHGREWYVPSASLTRHITNVVREHGQPDAARFGAKPVEIPMPHRTVSTKMMSNLGPRHFAG